ncbi:hypothetical protein [Micromonospora sp. CPCC 206061]|uniref:hypothetical protein n=1 Tax=Micromonospora sp. CPCC 206061 TaxID=3122410 RepID=UPI002FF33828
MEPVPVHWQFCRNGTDITSQPLYAEDDADEARAWAPEGFCVVVLTRDDSGAWRIDTSDGRLPDDAHEQEFTRPAHVLDYLTQWHGVPYDVTTADL